MPCSRSLERTKSHVIHTWSVDHLKNVLFLTDRGSHADHTLITCDQLYTNLSPSSSDPGVIFRITCDSHQPGSRLDHSRSRRVPYPLYNWITCDLLDHSWITCTSHVIRRITSIHGWITSDHFRITRDFWITCGPDVFQVIRKSYVFRLITREHLRITFGFRDDVFKTHEGGSYRPSLSRVLLQTSSRRNSYAFFIFRKVQEHSFWSRLALR